MKSSQRNTLAIQFRVLLMTLLLCVIPPLPQASAFDHSRKPAGDVKKKIEELTRASDAETVGVAFHDLATGGEVLINADENFHAASTMKVPVMMEIYRQAAQGKFSLDDAIPIKNDFLSIADGSHYSVSVEDDSEPSLYKKVGQTETIRELMRLMIIASSNLATNILIEKVTAPRVMHLMHNIGANRIRVLRGVEDSKAYERGMNNTTTARDLMIILRRIAERRAVSEKASDEMVKVMLDQQFNEGIPAGLPRTARVAHKTGSITKVNHDAAIIFLPNRKPYVLVVLTRGIQDEKRAHKLIADISRVIYESAVGMQQSARAN
ncbi:MAG TPA: serine hydrolase [Blastocatellia bacterium]|nr:serine hydrolase [Blastocatellia bacterium]